MKKLVTLALGVVALVAFADLGVAQQKAEERRSLDRFQPLGRVDKAPKLITVKVTGVNVQTQTFTGMSKGAVFTFNASKLKALPEIGAIIDVTYTGTGTPGGPMEAINLNSSKSNVY